MTVCEWFGFLSQLENLDASALCSATANLVSKYKADLEDVLANELVQVPVIMNLYKADFYDNMLKLYKVIVEKDFKATFPNVEIALRMYWR